MRRDDDMKQKAMTHNCMNKSCDWEETSHKLRDGIKCPKCNGSVMSVEPTDAIRTTLKSS
jgi:predicted Zn-ribbon and HTH transcriptional regulator